MDIQYGYSPQENGGQPATTTHQKARSEDLAELTKQPALRTTMKDPRVRRLMTALAASTVGDWLYGTALIVFVYEETRSPGWVAATGIFRLLPYVFLSPIAGALADRFDRRMVMFVSDLIRASLMFVLAAVAAAGVPIVIPIAIALLSTAAGTPFGPALTGLTPKLVDERHLAATNATMSTIEHTALIAGPALGSMLLILGSAETAFALNGVTFLVSAAFIYSLPVHSSSEDEPGRTTLMAELTEGIRAIATSTSVSVPVMIYSLASLAYGFEIVALVLVSEELLGMGSQGLGFLHAAMGAGGVAAAGLSSRLAQGVRVGRTLAIGLLFCGGPLALLALTEAPVIACVLVAGIGAGNILVEVMTVTVLQRVVPGRVLARVSGVLDSVAVMAILIGSVGAPLLIRGFGLRASLVTVGTLVPGLLILLAPKIKRLSVAGEEKAAELVPIMDSLESTGVFVGISRQALEHLAGSAEERIVAAGDVLVAQGEPATDFYVVTDGTFEVLTMTEQGHRTVNTLVSNDYFGEIGLLERIPRTATVRARTPGSVLSLSGSDFLSTVNPRRLRSTTLMDGVAERLARTHPSYAPVSTNPEADR